MIRQSAREALPPGGVIVRIIANILLSYTSHNGLDILTNFFLAHFRLETRLSPETISNCSREMHKSI